MKLHARPVKPYLDLRKFIKYLEDKYPNGIRQMADDPTPLLLMNPEQKGQERYARDAGFRDIIMKPVRQSDLYNQLIELFAPDDSPQPVSSTTVSTGSIAPPAPETVVESSASNVHVLLVEDYPINRKVALKQLDKLGYSADVAVHGQEAIEKLIEQREAYTLVLMDLQMPVMDGLTATREIRRLEATGELAPHIPIIAMTANAIKGDLEKCLEAGMDDYVSKPVRTRDLASKLEKWRGAAVHTSDTL